MGRNKRWQKRRRRRRMLRSLRHQRKRQAATRQRQSESPGRIKGRRMRKRRRNEQQQQRQLQRQSRKNIPRRRLRRREEGLRVVRNEGGGQAISRIESHLCRRQERYCLQSEEPRRPKENGLVQSHPKNEPGGEAEAHREKGNAGENLPKAVVEDGGATGHDRGHEVDRGQGRGPETKRKRVLHHRESVLVHVPLENAPHPALQRDDAPPHAPHLATSPSPDPRQVDIAIKTTHPEAPQVETVDDDSHSNRRAGTISHTNALQMGVQGLWLLLLCSPTYHPAERQPLASTRDSCSLLYWQGNLFHELLPVN
mmetsp:Transcript_43713/g.71052  ORF Transcript_43713/g.71052 Transcript_43713/m.71052 type:complete len:311 (+) Transcript_43713:870-1802(+)